MQNKIILEILIPHSRKDGTVKKTILRCCLKKWQNEDETLPGPDSEKMARQKY